MATYLSVPLKRTWEVDLVKPLKTFIASTYNQADPEEYTKALQEFHKLRNNVIAKSVDKHESALEVLYRYHDQLAAIESKFPIAENAVRINFKWQDAFDKESLFSGRRTLSIASGGYELVCLLFNIAALQSQIAASQNADSDEGLKTGARLFQLSAGIYTHMKDIVLSHVQNDPTPDLQPDTIGALASLMVAQAQDCICRKAVTGKMKPAIVVKLCHQASDLYADAMKLLQLQSIRDLWPKDWISSVAGKQAAYHALAEYFQSHVVKETKDFGEEIARLRHAKDLMSAAETRGGAAFVHQSWVPKIKRALDEANKDNDLIYHARVPDLSALAALGKAPVAKPTPIATSMSSNFTDLFEKVVPLAVHTALQTYEGRKGEIVNIEVGRLREATQLLNSILASLNLPASIEDLSGTKVPVSVLEKAAKVREMGGIASLIQLMQDLPDLLTRNKEILTESVRMLDEEEASDRQLKQQFGDRWTRTPSSQLTAPIRAESAKYQSILDNAISADTVVQERFGKSREGIDLLSQSDDAIEKSLPSSSPVAALQGSPVVAKLRELMEQVEAIKAERDVTENEIKSAQSDMSSRFMTALAQDGAIDEQALSVVELDRIYSPLREQVSDSVHRQEALVANIQRSNDEFVAAKSGQSGMSREEKLKELATAYDSFVELQNNLQEGTKFYNDLTQLLVKFQSKVSDLCFARKTEKEELMKDLQRTIANAPAAQPPIAPAYQQPTEAGSDTTTQASGQGAKVPPPRPPPPTLPPQSQSQPVPASAPAAPPATAPAVGQPQPYAQGVYNPGPYPAQQPMPAQAPYPPQPAGYGAAASPYPMYPQQAFVPPPMPTGYNPYQQYNYPGQGMPQPYPPQQYPGYPQQPAGYPQQQWR